MKSALAVLGFLLASFAADGAPLSDVKVDPKLQTYQAVDGISGSLKIVGSDTMKHEMELVAASFMKHYPSVKIEVEGKGSATAPPPLLAGTSQFAPMSRGMKAKEVDDFKKKYGYPPLALPTSIDMLAVYVNKDNPIKGLTLQQVDAIYSSTRKGGYAKDIRTWGDLGLTGEWADKPIKLYGRNKISGTYKFFQEHTLFNGAFRPEVHEEPDSDTLVQLIAHDKYAIGYSGIGYKVDDVRAVPLALDAKSTYVTVEPAHAYSGDYPLTRMLLLYMNHKPGSELDPLRREFIKYLYSREGQGDVLQSGYLPLGEHVATRALAAVELDDSTPVSKLVAAAAPPTTEAPSLSASDLSPAPATATPVSTLKVPTTDPPAAPAATASPSDVAAPVDVASPASPVVETPAACALCPQPVAAPTTSVAPTTATTTTTTTPAYSTPRGWRRWRRGG